VAASTTTGFLLRELLYHKKWGNQHNFVDLCLFLGYTNYMRKAGRPPLDPRRTKKEYLEIRLETSEKRAFSDAADAAGMPLSTWVRERLRRVARKELEELGRPIAFLQAS
jgi:hypothetical protein